MCGRFAITLPNDAIARLFEARPANDLPDVPNFNVCPTTDVHTIIAQHGQRRLIPTRWGFVPHWYKEMSGGPLLINARAETIAEKPAFRDACRTRRAVIVASGFYEWNRDGDERLPWYITRADGAPLVFAAVWQNWQPKAKDVPPRRTAAIVTTAAGKPMSRIHHRVPVVLDMNDVGLWLGEQGKGAARLMRAAGDEVLRWHRVGQAVNSNRATGAELIAPLAADGVIPAGPSQS